MVLEESADLPKNQRWNVVLDLLQRVDHVAGPPKRWCLGLAMTNCLPAAATPATVCLPQAEHGLASESGRLDFSMLLLCTSTIPVFLYLHHDATSNRRTPSPSAASILPMLPRSAFANTHG